MQFAWHPTEILLRLVVRCSAYRFSCESAFAPFSIGTEILPLSSLNPPFHISLLAGYSIFKVHGNLTFHIYPDIRKAKYSKKMKNFLNFFISQKRQKNKTFENTFSKVLLRYIQLYFCPFIYLFMYFFKHRFFLFRDSTLSLIT